MRTRLNPINWLNVCNVHAFCIKSFVGWHNYSAQQLRIVSLTASIDKSKTITSNPLLMMCMWPQNNCLPTRIKFSIRLPIYIACKNEWNAFFGVVILNWIEINFQLKIDSVITFTGLLFEIKKKMFINLSFVEQLKNK